MKIREFARQTGLTVHTLRFYEKAGLLDSRHVQRDRNNYRSYSEAALERLKLVKKFQSIGCPLSELKEILQDYDSNSRSDLDIIEWIVQKMKVVDQQRDELDQTRGTLQHMLDIRMAFLNDADRNVALKRHHALFS